MIELIETVLQLLAIAVVMTIVSIVLAYPAMLLWNSLSVSLFGLSQITYFQAFSGCALLVILRFLAR